MTGNRNPLKTLKCRLYEYAQRFEEAEYNGEVPSQDPSRLLFTSLILWATLVLLGNQIVQFLAPGWVVGVVAIPWLLVSGFLVRFGMACYHGLTIPEYSAYLDRRTDHHARKEDEQRARKLERNINRDIQDLKNMEIVESVAVWGDGVDVELQQRRGENDE